MKDYLISFVSQDIKTRLSYCCPDKETYWSIRVEKNVARREGNTRQYTVPWGDPDKPLSLSGELIDTGEFLFQPKVMMNDYEDSHVNIQQLVWDVLATAPVDYRQTLAANIVVSGGVSYLPGLMERLELELEKTVPALFKDHWKGIRAAPWRKYGAYRGGATLTNFNWFQKNWITKEMYAEHGPDRLNFP